MGVTPRSIHEYQLRCSLAVIYRLLIVATPSQRSFQEFDWVTTARVKLHLPFANIVAVTKHILVSHGIV